MPRGRRAETRWHDFPPLYRRKSCHRVGGAVAALAVVLAVAPAATAAKAPQRSVPQGYIGVVADGPVFDQGIDLGRELDLMVRTGVESVRTVFDWDGAQPYRSFADVPEAERGRFRDEAGVPTDWAPTDRLVDTAARSGLRLLPVIVKSPRWAARYPDRAISPPHDIGAYAGFAGALVRRYGPGGDFWRERPDLRPAAIRRWQLWNEPDITFFWPDLPFAPGYVTLLREASAAIREADPGARVVLAGLTNDSWNALEQVYRAGGRRHFDVVAVQSFTGRIANYERILALVRRTMRRHGDARKPLTVTELSWPSSLDHVSRRQGYQVTERGQAQKVAAILPRLAKVRRRYRIESLYWYTWMSYEALDYDFDYAGLRRHSGGNPVPKPAFHAFRRAALRLEGCRRKSVATRCDR
jgi:hypothetical protein